MDIDSDFRNLNLKSPEDDAPMQMDAAESAHIKVQTHLEFCQLSDIHLFIELVLLSDLDCVGDSSLFGVIFNSKGKEKEDISESLEKLHIEESSSGSAGSSSISFKRKPVIIIVVGMAGIVC